jgi:hypothetical protein
VETVTVQYVGPYGRGKSRASVSGVGELFYNQVVTIPKTVWMNVEQSEFKLVTEVCNYVKSDGTLCGGIRAEGSDLCEVHLREIKSSGKLPRPLVSVNPVVEKPLLSE